MILNLGSISFNADIISGGGTPAWGTEMGQGEGYKFSFENSDEFLTALVYNKVDERKVYCPLGKGGNKASDYEFVIASLFKKIYVNGLFVRDSSFLLLVTKKLIGNNHIGRRSLKYNPAMTYDGVNYNKSCYDNIEKVLGLTSNSAWFVHEINVRNQDELHFVAHIINANHGEKYQDSSERKEKYLEIIRKSGKDTTIFRNATQKLTDEIFQQIIYGAPGTGKSHAVKTETEAWEKEGRVVRTTFHPDSDYATFVGAYKPTTDSVQRYDITNKPIMRDGVPVMEQIITYNFVEQAFLQAYIEAWKDREKPEFLVIEEINRGNCAQIFGDLFQLLDRGDNGYSEYAIRADTDLQKHLCKAFEDVEIEDYPNIKSGTELLLPNNLYIRATMNTSDQSLFPIDSAFKRRWDWKYVPISKGNNNGTELNWKIEIDGNQYDWWTFVKTINKHVFDTTNSEDKQLGFFFCKAKNNIISAETFVCKVIFYLWNDVFKDFGFDDKIFEDKEDSVNPKLSFDKFYMANGAVNEKKIKMFLKNLDIMPIENEDDPEDEDGNKINSDSIGRDYTKYSINGIGQYAKNNLAAECVKKYIELNPLKTADEVLNDWLSLDNIVPHFIESKEQYDARTDNSKRSHEIQCGDTVLYVAHTGYGSNGKADILKEAVNNKGWGISIDKV